MKLCECGCGWPAPLSGTTDANRGYVKGEPTRFILGHVNRGKFGENSSRWSGGTSDMGT